MLHNLKLYHSFSAWLKGFKIMINDITIISKVCPKEKAKEIFINEMKAGR
jgi:hypothetical protein